MKKYINLIDFIFKKTKKLLIIKQYRYITKNI